MLTNDCGQKGLMYLYKLFQVKSEQLMATLKTTYTAESVTNGLLVRLGEWRDGLAFLGPTGLGSVLGGCVDILDGLAFIFCAHGGNVVCDHCDDATEIVGHLLLGLVRFGVSAPQMGRIRTGASVKTLKMLILTAILSVSAEIFVTSSMLATTAPELFAARPTVAKAKREVVN